MRRKRHGLFPNDLVHFPRKAFFKEETPVPVPCPPHWISPLWEQEYHSKAEQIPYLKHEARNTQPLFHPCHKSKSVPSHCPKKLSTASQMSCVDTKADPFLYLNHQDGNKTSLPRKHHTANQPKPDCKSRPTVPLIHTKQHLISPLLNSKYQHETPLDSNHKMEAATNPNHLPKIFADFGHLHEDHLSQQFPSSKYHQAELSLMGNRTKAVKKNKTFSKHQATAAHKPVKSTHSFEVFPRPRFQDRVLTTRKHPTGGPSPFCPDRWSKTISFKTSDLDYWVHAKTFKVFQPSHDVRETVSLLRCIDNRSKDPSKLLSDLNGKTRATTACPPCPQHWTIATALPSPAPKHQTNTPPTPSQDFKPLEVPSSCLENLCAKTSPSVFREAPLGPDYKTKDPSGLSPFSEHRPAPIIIPICSTLYSKEAQDSQLEDTALLFPYHQKSTLEGSDVQVTPLQYGPGLNIQRTQSLVHHQDPEVIGSQAPRDEVLKDRNSETPTPQSPNHVGITPVDLDLSVSPPKPDYRATLPLSCELKAIDLCRNEHTSEPAASAPNNPQTTPPTEEDNQDTSQVDSNLTQRLKQPNSDCRATYSPSPEDHQTENVQNCRKQFTPQDQKEINPPGGDHQPIVLTDQDNKDKFSIDTKSQNKIDQIHWAAFPLDIEQKDINPSCPDPQITCLPTYDFKDMAVPGPDVLTQAKSEQQKMLPEVEHQGLASMGQIEWEASPQRIIDHTHLMPFDSEYRTFPASPRALIPHGFYHQAEGTPDANVHGILQAEQIVFMVQKEQECNHQVMTTEDLSHKAVFLSDFGFQNKDLIDPEVILPIPRLLHNNQQTENALNSNLQVSIQTQEDLWQAVPIEAGNSVITIEIWDDELTAILGPDPNHRAIHPPSPDFQIIPPFTTGHQEDTVPDANDEVSKDQLKRDSQGAMSPKDHQDITVPSQDQGATSSLIVELHKVALSGLNSQDKLQSIPNHQSEADTEITTPSNLYHSAKMLMDPEKIILPYSSKSPFVFPLSAENQNEAKLDVPNLESMVPSLDEEKTTPLSPVHRAQTLSGPKHPNEALTACDCHCETELSSENPEEVQLGLQHQTFSKKKRQTLWYLNYIKPYTVEGGDVSEKIIDEIINSIPQDEIKNDICRQIILQKIKKVSTPHSSDQCIPLDYPVCLICVSWIPNGCPHVWGMKYPCEAQLLVIPMPLSNSEGQINVKFILQVKHAAKCSIFTLPYSYYDFQGPLTHPLNSPVSTPKKLELPRPVKGKWLGFIPGKKLQPEERTLPTIQRPHIGKTSIKKDDRREEATPKEHRTFLRSILDMFQKKQRRN
ncbi:uncharacterized protein LOC127554208 [Antechinus flavipes]|uniref:uncharacterized protein LOC127554208 n=1 Tax=Antechinus flavipes TaxID=38775 RepID=UPI0022360280|nr:uncharacterized protein LOC127554208 [Antechinus flavipes]XP_051841522.1 uncharacterized protein LOC127554208 [Antechinus flavipes]